MAARQALPVFALPAYVAMLPLAIGLAGVSAWVFSGGFEFLLFTAAPVIMFAVLAFMMWAAVYTHLE